MWQNVFHQNFFILGEISTSMNFFTGIFTHLSSKMCIPAILKINSCLLSRLFNTGKVQNKTKYELSRVKQQEFVLEFLRCTARLKEV